MSVIYDALKKAEKEAVQAPLVADGQWCPEFIVVAKRPHPCVSPFRKGWVLGLCVVIALVGAEAYLNRSLLQNKARAWLSRYPSLALWLGSSPHAPADVESLKRQAETEYDNNHFSQAVLLWEKVEAQSIPDALLYTRLGLAYKKLGDLNKAESYDTKALALDPNNAQTLNNLGSVYLEENRTDDALRVLTQAGQASPSYADPYFHLGRLYEKQNNMQDAIRAYQLFLERYPDKSAPIAAKVKSHLEDLQGQP